MIRFDVPARVHVVADRDPMILVTGGAGLGSGLTCFAHEPSLKPVPDRQ
jgi:hypothetical protein